MTDKKRLPFSGAEWTAPEKPVKGLKIKNPESARKPADRKQQFDEAAKEFMVDRQERNKKAMELARQFFDTLKDRTLPDNRGPLAQDVENELITKLVNLALVVNQDESEPEGYGSVALINILLKAIFKQRDTINELSYNQTKLEKQLSSLRAALPHVSK